MSLTNAKYAVAGLRDVPELLLQVLRTFREQAARIEGDRQWSDERKAEMLAALRAEAGATVDTVALTVQSHRELLDASIEGALSEAEGATDPVERLTAEIRRDRAWNRVSRLLDDGVSPGQAARMAAEAGDLEALSAMRGELPFRLRGLHSEMPRQHAEEIIAATLAEVEQAARPLLPAPQREALDIRDSVGQLQSIVDMNISSVRGELDGARRASMMVTADGAMVDVDEAVPA